MNSIFVVKVVLCYLQWRHQLHYLPRHIPCSSGVWMRLPNTLQRPGGNACYCRSEIWSASSTSSLSPGEALSLLASGSTRPTFVLPTRASATSTVAIASGDSTSTCHALFQCKGMMFTKTRDCIARTCLSSAQCGFACCCDACQSASSYNFGFKCVITDTLLAGSYADVYVAFKRDLQCLAV
jgi:hypothetical protein